MILHKTLPLKPWMDARTRRLPGLSPVSVKEWLLCDELFAEQMALREQLLDTQHDNVFICQESAKAPAEELLHFLVNELPSMQTYINKDDSIIRPDGKSISLYKDHPLKTAGKLVQEDLMILQQNPQDHFWYLKGGLLCFPSSWLLSQKIGCNLGGIHKPVNDYHTDMEKRVTRIFNALKPEQVLMRANFLIYADADLYQPRAIGEAKPMPPVGPRFVRVERQTLRKLPNSQAIVFAIHTFVAPAKSLNDAEFQQLATLRPEIKMHTDH